MVLEEITPLAVGLQVILLMFLELLFDLEFELNPKTLVCKKDAGD